MVVAERSVADWVDLVRSEFVEMPGLTLTKWQMRRLWHFDAALCDAVVDALLECGFLRRRADNSYARAFYDV
jgi:hypothetical protein